MEYIKFKDRLKEIYLTEDEFNDKCKEYKKVINKICPEAKKIDLTIFEKNKEFASSSTFKENKETIFFKIGSEKIIDYYTHYDMLGYNFDEAILEFYESIYTDTTFKTISADNKYFSEFKFFIKSLSEKMLLKNFKAYAKSNPLVLLELGEKVDFLPQEEYVDVQKTVENKDRTKAINKALHSLSPREERILRLTFGFDGDFNQYELGQKYNVSHSRIQQVQVKALRKLRHPSRSNQLKEFDN